MLKMQHRFPVSHGAKAALWKNKKKIKCTSMHSTLANGPMSHCKVSHTTKLREHDQMVSFLLPRARCHKSPSRRRIDFGKVLKFRAMLRLGSWTLASLASKPQIPQALPPTAIDFPCYWCVIRKFPERRPRPAVRRPLEETRMLAFDQRASCIHEGLGEACSRLY